MECVSLFYSNASLGQKLFSLHWRDKSGLQVGKSKMLAFILIRYVLPMFFHSKMEDLLKASSLLFKISFLAFSPMKSFSSMGTILEADMLGMQMEATNGRSFQRVSTYEVLNRQLIWTTFTDSIGYFAAAVHAMLASKRTALNCICNVSDVSQKCVPMMLGRFDPCGHTACFLCSKNSIKCRTCHGVFGNWTRIR